MEEARRIEIERLALDAHEKRVALSNLAATNVYGLSPEAARASAVRYAIARAESADAEAALEAAIRKGE